jgi:hypothetical protein
MTSRSWFDEVMNGYKNHPPTVEPLQAVVVTTRGGVVIRGALSHRYGDGSVVLKHAAISNRDQNGVLFWTPFDGEVVVPGDNIEYLQTALDASILGYPGT